MSTTTAPTNEELAAMVAELAVRAETAEQKLARIDAERASELNLLNLPPQPVMRTQFTNAFAERQEQARLGRVRAREAEVEAERLQAIKDAPKRAKRDGALAAHDEQLLALASEYEERKRRIAADRVQLARSPL